MLQMSHILVDRHIFQQYKVFLLMELSDSKIFSWFFSIPYRALHRAYKASKRVRNIQRDYLSYKNALGTSSKRSLYSVAIYVESILNQSLFQIYWGLLEFKISIKICNFFSFFPFSISKKYFFEKTLHDWENKSTLQEEQSKELNIYTRSSKQEFRNWINTIFLSDKKEIFDWCSSKNFLFNYSIEKNSFLYTTTYNKNIEWERLTRKLAWIEAVLDDLVFLKKKGWFVYKVVTQKNSKVNDTPFFSTSWTSTSKDIPYESLGLVPRSITRTLSRFQTELAGRSASLVLPEFRLAKYQAVASLQYLTFLILGPWIALVTCKILFLEPLIENWWNTSQSQIFLSLAQEEKALKRLQEVEELLWLDIIMADSSAKQPQDLSAQIHQKTINLVETYNQESIQTILHLFTNFISILVVIFLLIWGKKRLAILNSWVQEVFYSLSDTMKAFFILLFTDLCIGFHSPHGWEIFIGFLLEHFGFSHNKHVISCFVSTFPVILDTVFKYWIFRHLNRISPSIVVSYHTMSE